MGTVCVMYGVISKDRKKWILGAVSGEEPEDLGMKFKRNIFQYL